MFLENAGSLRKGERYVGKYLEVEKKKMCTRKREKASWAMGSKSMWCGKNFRREDWVKDFELEDKKLVLNCVGPREMLKIFGPVSQDVPCTGAQWWGSGNVNSWLHADMEKWRQVRDDCCDPGRRRRGHAYGVKETTLEKKELGREKCWVWQAEEQDLKI